MTVKELKNNLNKLPADALVTYLWDGSPRSEVKIIWLANNGNVVLSEDGEVCYSDEDRPAYAPTEKQNKYWYAS